MTRFLTSGRGRRLLTLTLVGALALFVAPLSRTTADIHLPVVKVEEHWTLLINDPDPDISSPQISTQMARSPWAPRFCNFHLNSCDVPSFAQGGLQLQVWRDSTNLAVVTSSNRATMTTSNELVEDLGRFQRRAGPDPWGVAPPRRVLGRLLAAELGRHLRGQPGVVPGAGVEQGYLRRRFVHIGQHAARRLLGAAHWFQRGWGELSEAEKAWPLSRKRDSRSPSPLYAGERGFSYRFSEEGGT